MFCIFILILTSVCTWGIGCHKKIQRVEASRRAVPANLKRFKLKLTKWPNIQNYALQWCFKSVLLAKGNVGVSARGDTIKSLSNHHHHHWLWLSSSSLLSWRPKHFDCGWSIPLCWWCWWWWWRWCFFVENGDHY